MVDHITYPEAFVQNFLQILDIVFLIGQNKNILTLYPLQLISFNKCSKLLRLFTSRKRAYG